LASLPVSKEISWSPIVTETDSLPRATLISIPPLC
jgi:hypothetical protein